MAGLRREEVAVLAGVSADYYARLEQGRERNPSGQVVDAIGRALRLDAEWDEVNPALLQLMHTFPTSVAYVTNRRLAVLRPRRWRPAAA